MRSSLGSERAVDVKLELRLDAEQSGGIALLAAHAPARGRIVGR